jgi:hypothetical protein
MKESRKMAFAITDPTKHHSLKKLHKQIPLGKIIGDFSLWRRMDAGAS